MNVGNPLGYSLVRQLHCGAAYSFEASMGNDAGFAAAVTIRQRCFTTS